MYTVLLTYLETTDLAAVAMTLMRSNVSAACVKQLITKEVNIIKDGVSLDEAQTLSQELIALNVITQIKRSSKVRSTDKECNK